MYWTFAQQLAHMTVNGATTAPRRPVRLGHGQRPDDGERGSLIELTWRGAEPLTLADGIDPDVPAGRRHRDPAGWCGGGDQPRIGFGEAPRRCAPPGPLSVLRWLP